MTSLFISIYTFLSLWLHPFYMSVTEITHNAKTKSIEVSCRIFTDDLEKDYKGSYKKPIDLAHPADKTLADKYVTDYINEKLKLTIDGKDISLNYVGYEIKDDALWSYFDCENISSIKKINIYDAILLDHIKEQSNLIHVTVNGKRQSTKLDHQKTEANFSF